MRLCVMSHLLNHMATLSYHHDLPTDFTSRINKNVSRKVADIFPQLMIVKEK